MGKGLYQQTLDLMGKGWDKSALTHTALKSDMRQITAFLKERYGLERIGDVKPHMVTSHIKTLQEAGYSASHLQGIATAWREVARSVGKQNIVPRTNAELGISRSNADRYKPRAANQEKLAAIRAVLVERGESSPKDRALLAAHDLREAFGLRTKESLMSTKTTEREGRIYLAVEGAKGGRPREIEVRTAAQMDAIAQAHRVSREVGNAQGRIIPPQMTLKQFYDFQRNTLRTLGASKEDGSNAHTQRHGYAQQRLAETDNRSQVATELGHGRDEVVAHYIPPR
jgi:site-specific recombinase XerC